MKGYEKLKLNRTITLPELIYDLQRSKTDDEAEDIINQYMGTSIISVIGVENEIILEPNELYEADLDITYLATNGETTCRGKSVSEAVGTLVKYSSLSDFNLDIHYDANKFHKTHLKGYKRRYKNE